MQEVLFSKKQIGPMLEKYKISESNANFINIIKMFPDQTNYQIWAIKMVFDTGVNLDVIKKICKWAAEHQTEIKKLSKGNIVSYKSKGDIKMLMDEMKGLQILSTLNRWFSAFNTEQKELFRSNVDLSISPINALASSQHKALVEIFTKVDKLPKHKKDKMISLASALHDFNGLVRHITNATVESYDWDKEDFLAFLNNNANDCKVVFDKDNVVVVTVPSFESSEKLCGKGRTSWCITREDRFFNQYCVEPSNNPTQYMLFNFNYPEYHDLAHIGFTVREGNGITNAHSTTNQSLMDTHCIDGKEINITKALDMVGIPSSLYIHLRELRNFKWSEEAIEAVIRDLASKKKIGVLSISNGRFIIELNGADACNVLLSHTLINKDNLRVSNDNKAFVVLDANKDVNDNKSITVVRVGFDKYKTPTIIDGRDPYNNMIGVSDLSKLGLTLTSFVDTSKINPSILLHKYIDTGDEDAAIALMDECWDTIDVNYELDDAKPIYNIIDNHRIKVFKKIVQHPSFKCNDVDGAGETILDHLMYDYNIPGLTTPEEDRATKEMIDIVLDMPNYDFNIINENLDNAVNVACERPELLWVAERLIANPNININCVNDFNCTAIGNAIRKKNIEAIKLLAKRPDLVLRVEDKELANSAKINLANYLSKDLLDSVPEPKGELSVTDLYAELFARAFARTISARK